jgi:hypothetical protein
MGSSTHSFQSQSTIHTCQRKCRPKHSRCNQNLPDTGKCMEERHQATMPNSHAATRTPPAKPMRIRMETQTTTSPREPTLKLCLVDCLEYRYARSHWYCQ